MDHFNSAKNKILAYMHLPVDVCWEYQSGIDKYGYGTVQINGKIWKAHRLSYILFIGPIPEGLNILHTCDNRCCINPGHLYAGTQKDNVKDCMERGRRGKVGSKQKITDEQIIEIKAFLEIGKYTIRELSILYKVTAATIYRVTK
jgi:hypothetical protein